MSQRGPVQRHTTPSPIPAFLRTKRFWIALVVGGAFTIGYFLDPTDEKSSVPVTAIGGGLFLFGLVYLIAYIQRSIRTLTTAYFERYGTGSGVFSINELHYLVAGPATTFWVRGHYRAAVDEAARQINGAMQQRLGVYTLSERGLVEMAFGEDDARKGTPRFRPRGDRGLATYKNRTTGIKAMGVACFAGIRNVSAHETTLENWDRAYSFQLLAALSLFATWLDECDVDYGS